MTPEARYNLQRGKAENKLFIATDYTSNNDILDNYIISSEQLKKKIIDRNKQILELEQNKKNFIQFNKEINQNIEDEILRAVKEFFKK